MAHGLETMTNSRSRFAAVGLMAAVLGLAASAAEPASAATTAASKPAFSLSSGGIDGALKLRGTPGAQLRGSFRVSNLSKRLVTVRLQPADIRNATNGNADYATTRLAGAGRWLDLDEASVRLAPRTSRRVRFVVSVPAGARGASHYAGIVAIDARELAAAKATRKRTKSTKRAGFTVLRVNRQALPLTIRLPGPLERELALRKVELKVQPAGAGLVLALEPRGSVLMQSAKVELRVSRGARTVLSDDTTLGQLFPGSGLDYRIAWKGQPTKGDYRVEGTIRPKDAAPVRIDETVTFTPAKVKEFERETPSLATATPTGLPTWVWLALGIASAALIALSVAVMRLMRRAGAPAA